jgi:phthalate 4,5-dioxygenase reductase subunit
MDETEEFRPLRVLAAAPIAQGIFRFDLADPDGAALPEFTPGAHLRVVVPNGMVRRYSLCSDPAETASCSIAVKRDAAGQGGSVVLCDGVKPGDLLPCALPRNDFPMVGNPPSRLFIAGGIGITPIMSMIHHLQAEGRPPWKLVYLTRSPADTAFREELSAPALKGKVVIHHDGGDPDRAYDLWPLLEQPKGRHIHCCGPRGLMQAVRDMTGHWPGSAVHFEDFGTGGGQKRADDAPFTVRLAKSGTRIDVPAGTTILEALRAAGIAVSHSCESGTCGSCRTGLLDGAADHRDLVLMEHEKASHLMVCVSRAASGTEELVLDL